MTKLIAAYCVIGLLTLLVCLLLGWLLILEPVPVGKCYSPSDRSGGTNAGVSGLLDPVSGSPSDIQCDVFITEDGNVAFFNVLWIGQYDNYCIYSEVIVKNTSIGKFVGDRIDMVSHIGDPSGAIALKCFAWAEKNLPSSAFTKHWGEMAEY